MASIYKMSAIPPLDVPGLVQEPSNYVMSKSLASAVEVSIILGIPLLLTGEPGCGKSKLAYHLADRFGQGRPLVFNVKTTTVAKDLFYEYDALSHYRDIQTEDIKAKSKSNYIKLNALGIAIKSKKRVVVLIDEIDKAPRDLTNDILNELEELSFTITETSETFNSGIKNRPVVIFCSNSEKQLPDPFLRRCIYYHIGFPEKDQLKEIIRKRVRFFRNREWELEKIIDHFLKIRDLNLRKAPSTDELLKWATYLSHMNFDFSKLQGYKGIGDQDKDFLVTSYSILVKSKLDLDQLNEL